MDNKKPEPKELREALSHLMAVHQRMIDWLAYKWGREEEREANGAKDKPAPPDYDDIPF